MMKKARTGTQQYQVSSHDENIHFCAYMQAPAVLETEGSVSPPLERGFADLSFSGIDYIPESCKREEIIVSHLWTK